ncbi:hypothetical protein [uncultured Chryseobacterium sp.]|uniref:hypothetical protein n=1 Tax=uncultured Chryseobacterium sp. TaxID=259322 RepID=UPI0026153368|nr:hypothetical protein [uncultured Chryseobacterium sp.]
MRLAPFCPLSWWLPLNIFTKKKTEKKESLTKGGGAKKPKGNGISPEGWRNHIVEFSERNNDFAIMP